MANLQPQNRVLVFGTFDGIHPGHLHFLNEAKKLGNLYVSVASNESVSQRKGRAPRLDMTKRIDEVKATKLAIEVLPGDTTLNQWTALKIVKPDIVAVGFDQFGLKTVLQDVQSTYGFEIERISELKDEISI